MIEKKPCPQCGNLTYKMVKCIHCGAALVDLDDDYNERMKNEAKAIGADEDFDQRYGDMQSSLNLKERGLVRLLAFSNLEDRPFGWLRRLNVPRGWKALVYDDQGSLEKELGPGVYSVSKTDLTSNPLTAFLNSFRGPRVSIFLYPANEFSIQFMVPEKEGPYNKLANCNIRSAEGFIGGAVLGMVMRIEDPVRLLIALGVTLFNLPPVAKEAEPGSTKTQVTNAANPPLSDEEGASRSGNAVAATAGSPPPRDKERTANTPGLENEFNANFLWKRIRSEFVQIISSAVANESILEMRTSLDVRQRILGSISNSMKSTMSNFGLAVLEVSSFQFLCPDHDIICRLEATTAQEQAKLQSEKQAAQIRRERRQMSQDEAVSTLEVQKQVEKAGIATQADIDKTHLQERTEVALDQTAAEARQEAALDQKKAAAQERGRVMEGAEEDHRRQQDASNQQHQRAQLEANSRLELTLQVEKAQQLLALRNAALDADNARRMALLKTIKETGLPAESILATFLQERPELAQAYAEAMRARGYEERLALQREFETKLLSINTTDRQHVHDLLEEGIRQLGRVMAEAQKKQGPPKTIVNQIAPPALPASSQSDSQQAKQAPSSEGN